MKKAVSFVLIISVVFLLVFSLVSCNSENKIVKEWKFFGFDEDYFYGNDVYEVIDITFDGKLNFKKDGTLIDKYGDIYYWQYDKTDSVYWIAENIDDFPNKNNCQKAQIDKEGYLHIASYIYRTI